MGNRVGLARTQVLIQNLKRELTMLGSTMTNLRVDRLAQKFDAPSTVVGAATVTIAQILTGILVQDPTTDRAWTLPTPALLVAGVSGYAAGDCFDFTVINTGTAGVDEIITITAPGSGGTLVGSGAVLTSNPVDDAFSSGSGLFRIRITSATAYVCYRIA